jgi:uncharacterized protein YjdB
MPLSAGRRLLCGLVAVFAVAACGGDPASPDIPPVVAITAANGVTSLAAGSSVLLSATLTDKRGKLVSGALFSWSSANSAIASVSTTGMVTSAQAGTTTISATSGGATGSFTVSVTPGTPAKLVMATQPTGGASGARLATQPVVEVRDQYDNVVTATSTFVTVALVGAGTITGSVTIPAQQGIARFTDLAVAGLAGGRSLQFSASGLTAVASAPFNITPGAAATLAYVGSAPRLRSGLPTTSPLQVQLRDRDGNDVAVAGRRVAVVATGGSGVTTAVNTTVLTDAQGRASFGALTLTGVAGTRTLTFVADSTTAITNATISALLSGGRATRLVINRDMPASVEAASTLAAPPVVQLLDSIGNTAPDAGVRVRATLQGGTGALSNATADTDTLGRATFSALTVLGALGVRSLQYAADGVLGVNGRAFTTVPPDSSVQPTSIITLVTAADTVQRVLQLDTPTSRFTPFLSARDAQGNALTARDVRWVARDPSRATVSADGVITGALPGRTFVVAQGSRTASVGDSLLVFVPRNATGPIVRATLPSYRITTDTFSITIEVQSRDGRPLSAIDLEVAWPGSSSFPFSPFNATSFTTLRTGVQVQQVDGQQNLRLTWASATPVQGTVQLLRLQCRVNQRNVGNQVVFTLNQLLDGTLNDLTSVTSVFNPVVIIR